MSTTNWYGKAFERAFTELAAGSGAAKTWKVALLHDTYVFSDAHDFFNDVSATEATGTGYSAGGIALTGATIAYTGGTFTIDFDNVAPVGLAVTCRYAVVYLSTGTGSTSPLVAYTDLTEDGEVEITGLSIHTSGLLTIDVPTPA